MYKLLIVDDEPIERQAISLLISNTIKGIQVVGEAANGYEALTLFHDYSPDIVIIDINMPGIDGLETIREMLLTGIKARYVIVTSFSRFEYARTALRLGVEDFLIKPAEPEQIKISLQKIMESLDLERKMKMSHSVLEQRISNVQPIIRSDVVKMLMDGGKTENVRKLLELLNIRFVQGFVILLKHHGLDYPAVQRIDSQFKLLGLNTLSACRQENVYTLLIVSDQAGDAPLDRDVCRFLLMFLAKNGVSNPCLGAGEVVMDVDRLSDSYRTASYCFHYAERNRLSVCYPEEAGHIEKERETDIREFVGLVSDRVLCSDRDGLKELIGRYCQERMQDMDHEPDRIREYFHHTILLIKQKISEIVPYYHLSTEEMGDFPSAGAEYRPDGVYKWVERILLDLVNELDYLKDSAPNSYSAAAHTFIRENFHKDLRLEDLAGHLGVSPGNASKIIKMSAGKSFSELLTEIRLERAKELLKQREKNIKEVTYEVGFNSQHYFSRVFKKYNGISPSDYQTRYL